MHCAKFFEKIQMNTITLDSKNLETNTSTVLWQPSKHFKELKLILPSFLHKSPSTGKKKKLGPWSLGALAWNSQSKEYKYSIPSIIQYY